MKDEGPSMREVAGTGLDHLGLSAVVGRGTVSA